MGNIANKQPGPDEVDISKVVIDIKSRDDIPKILLGLQQVYINVESREKIFNILKNIIKKDTQSEYSEIDLWRIFVLGMLKFGLNENFDRLKELVDNHTKIREMLGHGRFDRKEYSLKTIKNNINIFTTEALLEINSVIVQTGYHFKNKKKPTYEQI